MNALTTATHDLIISYRSLEMDALPPPPAVVQLQEKCLENAQSMCHKSEVGYSVFIRTWQEDAHQLMERLNQVPLQSLQLAATAVSDRDLREFKNTQTLTSLRLLCMPIDGSGLDSLPICENVERLYIERCMLNGKQLAGFRKFPNVRQLKLEVWSHSDEAIRCVAPMTRLETFSIVSHGAFSGDGLIGLKDKEYLWYVGLEDTTVSRGFEHLVDSETLTHVNVFNTEVNDEALENIAKIKSLKALYVGSEKITNRGLGVFSGHPRLESVHFCGRGKGTEHLGITEDFFIDLVSIPNLKSLRVSCRVTSSGIAILQNLKKLESLKIDWPTMTQEELEFIRAQLPNCEVGSRFLLSHQEPSEDDD